MTVFIVPNSLDSGARKSLLVLPMTKSGLAVNAVQLFVGTGGPAVDGYLAHTKTTPHLGLP